MTTVAGAEMRPTTSGGVRGRIVATTRGSVRARGRAVATMSGIVRARGGVVAMTGVLERAADFFLAPPERAGEPVAPPPAVTAARAVVLGSPPDVASLAAALALSLRSTSGAPVAVVASWGGSGELRPTAASRSAARLASRLASHGLASTPRGRLAWLELPAEPQHAAEAVRRASALVDGPLVTALAGPRPPELDALVAEHDLAVVAAPPDSVLARAAVARLADRGIAASACAPLRRGLARTLALAGLAAPRLDTALPSP